MNKEIEAFYTKAANTPELVEKLKAATSAEEIVALAKAEGFLFQVSELNGMSLALSDDVLEGVSGGSGVPVSEMSVEDLVRHVLMRRSKGIEEDLKIK